MNIKQTRTMNKKQLKAFDEMIEDITRDTIMEMYRKALDVSSEVYKAMLVKMRDTIDYELKKKEANDGGV